MTTQKREKKRVPELRFPGFEGEWEEKRLGKLTSKVGSGSTPRGGVDVYTTTGIPFIRSQNVVDNQLLLDETHIPVSVHEKMAGSTVLPNDVLLNITGASIGRSCVVPSNGFQEANVNQHVSIIRLKNDSPHFLQALLSSHHGQKLVYQGMTGSGREGLNFQSIRSFRINIPSIKEQQKIATFLTSIDTRIQLLEKKKTLLEQYKKGVMQQLFKQEIRFKDQDGKEFPKWEKRELGDIGFFKTSSVNKLSYENDKEVFLVNYMNVYRHEEINNNSVKEFQVVTANENQLSSTNLRKGDILFTPSSETPSDIGHSVVIFEDIDNAVYSYHLMRFRPSIKIDILYSHYFCNIPSVLKQFSRFATGSTRYTISVRSFSKVKVQLPCLSEQTKIAHFLSSLDRKIAVVEQQIVGMKEWKKGVLQRMFV